MFYIGLKRESMKKSSCLKPQGMKHHLVDLYQVCSNYAPGAKKFPRPRGHMFYIGLYRENIDTSSHLKPPGLEP